MNGQTLIFDVNGTLLDTAADPGPEIDRLVGRPLAWEAWNQQALAMTFTDTLSGVFRPFATIADAALQMVAAKEGREIGPADRKAVVERLATQPPFPDVAAGLARLMAAGFRLAVLTNGSHATAGRQLEHAKLHGFFGPNVFSVEAVKKYKPAPETYHYVADYLGCEPAGLTRGRPRLGRGRGAGGGTERGVRPAAPSTPKPGSAAAGLCGH